MKLSDLKYFLSGNLAACELSSLIQDEVAAFRVASLKKGSVMNVVLINDSAEMRFGSTELIILCKAFLEKKIDHWIVSYICDALLMSNTVTFSDDTVRDSVDGMTDPEVNGLITEDKIKKTIATFSNLK
jgi:hypothetical protein